MNPKRCRDRRFKSLDKLREMYSQLGIRGDKEVAAYCQGGYRAANSFVALRLLGYGARVYLGSWNEWANDTETPVER